MSRDGSVEEPEAIAFRSIDLLALRYEPLNERPSKVSLADLGHPGPGAAWFADWLDTPAQGARRRCAQAALLMRSPSHTHAGRPVVAALGGHVVKTGCGAYLVDWINRGILSGLALNGSAAIHDLELAIAGKTSEDVGSRLMAGTFGFARETSDLFAAACDRAASRVDRAWAQLWPSWSSNMADPVSIIRCLVAALRAEIPLTVHVAIGTDIVHMTPALDGAALGKAALDDFRRICRIWSPRWLAESGSTSAARSSCPRSS